METLGSFFQWIGANEAVLSGIAAGIVILGVGYAPIRRLLSRRRRGEVATPSAAASATSQPVSNDRPSIAVMPFANLSGDPEHAFIADGLTEDIILGLSRFKQLFVIARNTCFTYKGKTPDAGAVSRELGVRYVLEGSVRVVGDRIRVTAQLVDAPTRAQTWTERFDRRREEIFEVDDEVTEAIIGALAPALRLAEVEHARRASPDDLTAWSLVNRAWFAVQSDLGDRAIAEEAIEACEKALVLDPDYAFAHAVLAHAKSLLLQQPQPEQVRHDAMAAIERALELAPDDPVVHHCHAALLGNLGRTEDGIRAWQRAVELDPNSAGARAGLGIGMIYARRADEALPLIDGALRRSPADPLKSHWLGNRALVLLLTGHVDEAVESARRSIGRKPSRLAYAVLAAAHAHRGEIEEAGEAYGELSMRFPGLSADGFARFSGALAPDATWGESVSAAVLLASQAVKPSSGSGESEAAD